MRFHRETTVAAAILIITCVVAVTCFNDGTDQAQYVIVNNHFLATKADSITIRCRSDSNHYGVVTLAPKGQYRFAVNMDVYRTGLYCDISAGEEYGLFSLYDTLRDRPRCTACIWDVSVNGVWGFPQEARVPDMLFKWQ